MLKLLTLTALLVQGILGPPVDKKQTIAGRHIFSGFFFLF